MTINKTSSPVISSRVNVGGNERFISAVAAGLLFYSLIDGKRPIIKSAAAAFLLYRSFTGHCPVYGGISKGKVLHAENINIRTRITVNKPRAEVYAFWRKLDNLPVFMKHLVSVVETDGKHSEWTASIPGLPGTISWKAEIVKERLNEFIGWNSLSDANIGNAGKVEFADAGDNRTDIKVFITYRAPLGKAGEQIARLFNFAFESRVRKELRNFRKHIEAIY